MALDEWCRDRIIKLNEHNSPFRWVCGLRDGYRVWQNGQHDAELNAESADTQ